MLKELTIISLVVVSIQTKTMCKYHSECANDECCYYNEGGMILSKRNELPLKIMHQGGWCEKYLLEGESCSRISKMNGHCGCGNAMICKGVPYPTYPTISSVIKRRNVYGHSVCSPSP